MASFSPSSDSSDFQPQPPSVPLRQLSAQEWYEWQLRIEAANQNNLLHHCRQCDREWVSSQAERCACGSASVERIACWQFPDG
ncbi:MAG: hypothetical protein WBA57_12450 [Elainellaceae cyanobacterium]